MEKNSFVNLLMLVDDNKIDTFVNEKIVKLADFADRTVTKHSSREALEYLSMYIDQPEKMPDALFLDLNMPVMNGFKFLEEFAKFSKEAVAKCKIVVLSSSDHAHDKEKSMSNHHVIGFLSKPLTAEKLALVQKLIKG